MPRGESNQPQPEQLQVLAIERAGSSVDIYHPEALLDKAKNELLMVYKDDVLYPFQGVRTSLWTDESKVDGAKGFCMSSTFRFMEENAFANLANPSFSPSNALADIINNRLASTGSLSEEISDGASFSSFLLQPTTHRKTWAIRTPNHGDFSIHMHNESSVILSNYLNYTTALGKHIQVRPEPIEWADNIQLLKEFSHIHMWLADTIAEAHGLSPLVHTYNFELPKKQRKRKSTIPAFTVAQTLELSPAAASGPLEMPDREKIKHEKISLNDIGGMESVKAELREMIASLQHPEIMEKWGAKRPHGMLLHGEPGTGKTMLVEALANELEAELVTIKSTDIYEKWVGSSSQNITRIFDLARRSTRPVVLFFDEIDSIIGTNDHPSSGGDRERNAVAGIFKQQMNTIAEENPLVFVAAATNKIEMLDSALIRTGRFDRKIPVPKPDEDARMDIFAIKIGKVSAEQFQYGVTLYDHQIDFRTLARATDERTGSDIAEILMRLQRRKAIQEATQGHALPITQEEILAEIQRFRREV